MTCEEMSQELEISVGSVYTIILNCLGMLKVLGTMDASPFDARADWLASGSQPNNLK